MDALSWQVDIITLPILESYNRPPHVGEILDGSWHAMTPSNHLDEDLIVPHRSFHLPTIHMKTPIEDGLNIQRIP